jgi:acyl-coenzyme A synthetase/AMP-(fatty) acid ligase
VTIDDASLGAGNVLFWLLDRTGDLVSPQLLLDRPWIAPDGTSRTSLSLADLLEATAAYRHIYRERGVGPGSVVVIQVRTPIDAYLHWVALAANGAIAAPVNPNLSRDAVREYSRRIGASGIIMEGEAAVASRNIWWHSTAEEESPVRVTTGTGVFACEAEYAYRPDDIVLLCHTSGTSSPPRAVSCSHHGFMVGLRNQMCQPSPLSGSAMLNALPVAHHSWFMTITWALLSGTRLVLASDQSALTLVTDVQRFQPSSIRSFSCTLREVARLNLQPGALRSVGLWMTTGDVSRRSDIAAVSPLGTHPVAGPNGVSCEPGMFVLDGFGSTELGHLHFSQLHAPGQVHEARCIGRPAAFATAAILDADGCQLPDGEVGYLAVRSEAVTPGYWKQPECTAKSRRAGFWITGDIGYRDEFGRYFHLDRCSDVIETPYGRVYSVLCEEELLRCIPEIERCVMLGRRGRDGTVRVVCLVESEDSGRDAAVWQRELNDVLARAALPPVAETVVLPPGTLPIGPTGKIRKFLARAELPCSTVSASA